MGIKILCCQGGNLYDNGNIGCYQEGNLQYGNQNIVSYQEGMGMEISYQGGKLQYGN